MDYKLLYCINKHVLFKLYKILNKIYVKNRNLIDSMNIINYVPYLYNILII